MKKQSIKVLALFVAAGTVLTGCSLLKEVNYTVTPDPLEMHGDSVAVTISGKIPTKYLHKKAAIKIADQIGLLLAIKRRNIPINAKLIP